jgi:hypothetical protein
LGIENREQFEEVTGFGTAQSSAVRICGRLKKPALKMSNK